MITLNSFIHRLKTSDIGSRIAKGAFWSLTGTAIAKLIVLIAGILCARILGKQAYGEFGMVRSTINMFVIFGMAGLGMTAAKFISEYRTDHKEKISSIYLLTNGFAICTGLIVCLILLLTAPIIADKTLHEPSLSPSLRIGAVLLFVTSINGAQTGVLQGFEDFKHIALNTFIGSVAESIFMLLGGYFYGVFGAVLGYGIGFFALYFANNISIRQNLKNHNIIISKNSFDKNDLRILYKFSLPAMLSGLMVTPVFWIIRAMLVRSNGFEELAVYEAAEQWRAIILFIPSSVAGIVLPILSNIATKDKNKFWKVLKYNIFLNAFVSLGIAVLVTVFSSYIMNFYGKGYTNTITLILLSFATVFIAVSNVVGSSIASRSKMWIGFMFNIIWAIIIISVTQLLLKHGFGSVGVALSMLIAYFIHTVYQLIYLKFSVKE